jgi:hypothetical protein
MAEKPVLNKAKIEAAEKKNAQAKQKAATAQAKITELKSKVPLAQKVVSKTKTATDIASRVGKKTGETGKSQGFIDKYQPFATKSQTEILDPFNQATGEFEAAEASMVDVPEAEYASNTSAFDLITSELNRMGLSSLAGPLREIFESGISDGDSLRLALSQRPEYKLRFSANDKRIAAGLTALSPAEYLQLEDQYQEVMRQYGLPASYYAKDATGKQIGFDELIGGDVSNTELEERLIAGQERVLKSNPEVLQAIKDFYGDSITNGDILAYSLDPKNALKDIQRKVAAAEIGGAALAQKLATSATGAEALAALGVTKAQAQQGFVDVAQMAPRGSALSEIYNEAPYNQDTATAEVFGTSGAAAATQKRKKLTALEQATFGGQSGLAQGALARNTGAGGY